MDETLRDRAEVRRLVHSRDHRNNNYVNQLHDRKSPQIFARGAPPLAARRVEGSIRLEQHNTGKLRRIGPFAAHL